MTRREYDQLREIYQSLVQATTQLGDMIIFAARDFADEDIANAALEQSSKGADDGNRPV